MLLPYIELVEIQEDVPLYLDVDMSLQSFCRRYNFHYSDV